MAAEAQKQMKIRIRKGDMVRVTTGRDKQEFRSKTARVLSVDARTGTVTVEHAHMVKRHTRPNPAKNIKGGIVEREAPIHISNVRLVCGSCNRPTRIGYQVEFETVKATRRDGSEVERKRIRRKTRVCRRCGATLDK